MGSIMSAIRDDEDEYLDLCKKYNETPHRKPDAFGNLLADCYGAHAKQLQARQRAEWDAQSAARQPNVTPPAAKQQPVFKNSIGQEIKVGDRVVTVTTGYSHRVSIREGVFTGLSPAGKPQARVKTTVGWGSNKKTAERLTTLKSGRIYKLA